MPAPMTATSALSEVSNVGYDVAGAVAFQQQSGFPTSAISNSGLAPGRPSSCLCDCQRGDWKPSSANKPARTDWRRLWGGLRVHPCLLLDLVLEPRIDLE